MHRRGRRPSLEWHHAFLPHEVEQIHLCYHRLQVDRELMRGTSGKLHEHTFNVELARVMATTDPRWLAHADEYILAERTGTLDRGRADILIDDPQIPAAAVESSFDPADADHDAKARLGRTMVRGGREILAVFAVHIPEECRAFSADAVFSNLKNGSQHVGYALHQKTLIRGTIRRWPAVRFIHGTVHDASNLIGSAAMPKEVIDAHAEDVSLLLKQAAVMLQSNLSAQI